MLFVTSVCYSTQRQECPFEICISASDCGQFLQVKKVTAGHNHPISKAVFDLLPQQRRLDDSEQRDVACMIRLGGNKKLLQTHIQETCGKKVSLRDLHNLSAKLNKTQDIINILQQLKDEQGDICF